MCTTIDLPDDLFQQAQSEAARRGVPLKDLLQEGLRTLLQESRPQPTATQNETAPWFGRLHRYADNAQGNHDLEAIRASIHRERKP